MARIPKISSIAVLPGATARSEGFAIAGAKRVIGAVSMTGVAGIISVESSIELTIKSITPKTITTKS